MILLEVVEVDLLMAVEIRQLFSILLRANDRPDFHTMVEEAVVAVDLQILLGNLLFTELLQAHHEFLPKRQRSSQWTTFRQPIKYGTGS